MLQLERLGYFIKIDAQNQFGCLRQIRNPKEGYKWEGQSHYDQVGDAVQRYI